MSPLVVFEGPEGAGKSTQLRRLAEWLGARGIVVVAVREPGGTVLGDEIRRILLEPGGDVTPAAEALLFMASRAQLVERSVRPALAGGATVLLDRFFLSTYAYQIAGRGLPDAEVRTANRLAVGDVVPDVTLLLALEPQEGLARAARRGGGGHDRMEGAEAEFHARVSGAFATYATPDWQAEHPECGPVVLVDAEGSEDAVFARVLEALRRSWPGSFPG